MENGEVKEIKAKKKNSILGGVFDKLKNIKHFEVIVLVAAAVLVCIIFFSTLNLTGNSGTAGNYGSNITDESSIGTDYDSELEIKLSKILSNIKGAGNVSVMIGEKNNVLVVATGASDVAVKMEIIKAVKSILLVDSALIEVIVGK